MVHIKRDRKIRNGAYIIAVPTAITAAGFLVTGILESINLFGGKTKEQLNAAENKVNIGKGISVLAGTAFAVGIIFSIKSRKTINRAVKTYNQK